jgi:hypothetical protein
LTRILSPAQFAGMALLVSMAAICCWADPNVVVSATASPEYTQRKFGGEKATPESYVVMQGHYFEGCVVDKSIERMPFRQIAEIFAPELARRQYWPAKDAKNADLLIVVHWGTTAPKISTMEMMAHTSPLPDLSAPRADKQMRIAAAAGYDQDGILHPERADPLSGLLAEQMNEDMRLLDFERIDRLSEQISNDFASASTAQLLGYTKTLRKFGKLVASPAEEYALRLDLSQMRYFIILRAYDLRAPTADGRRHAVWTLHLNVSSPGNNFNTALDRMSVAAVDFVGRSTNDVETVRQPVREGKVEIGPLVILGEVN